MPVDRARLHNTLEALADHAAAGIDARVKAPFPPETAEALDGMRAVLVASGLTAAHAEHTVAGWVILRSAGGGRMSVLDCAARCDDDGPLDP